MTALLVVSALVSTRDALAQSASAPASGASTIVCGSKAGERVNCAANTSGGVTLVKPLGTAVCELGRTWGYDDKGIWVSDGCGAEFSATAQKPATYGRYIPGVGFKVADTEYGDLNIRTYTYLRYLNQRRVDPTYTNTFGKTTDVQRRQDFELNKVQVYFFGWLMTPKFRYMAYVWTSNASLGQATQVVVAGNLNYKFSDYLTVGGGIGGLPGTRSTEGTFPYWLTVDERQVADEYLRPSYTTGIWANGKVIDRVSYQVMLGNNLSRFGIDAGQPNNDAFENVQIRVSDGSVIFAPALFAPDVQIEDATYRLLAVDAGVKYHGFSFDVEHYWRRINNFTIRGTGALPFSELHDTGFQMQASAMALPKMLQIYAGGSKVFGGYGNPSDFRAGANVFPWKNEVVRFNLELIDLRRSPVGSTSLPYSVGDNGLVFHTNVMIWF